MLHRCQRVVRIGQRPRLYDRSLLLLLLLQHHGGDSGASREEGNGARVIGERNGAINGKQGRLCRSFRAISCVTCPTATRWILLLCRAIRSTLHDSAAYQARLDVLLYASIFLSASPLRCAHFFARRFARPRRCSSRQFLTGRLPLLTDVYTMLGLPGGVSLDCA